jgi:hypothetical protein
MMAQAQAQHHHAQMRQMGLGTQTLGRHHSPNHMRQNSGKFKKNEIMVNLKN